MRRSLLPLALIVSCAASCGNGSDPANDTREIAVQTDEFDVPPGAEIFMCKVSDVVLDAPFDVTRVRGVQSTGGHHAVLFYTTEPMEPSGTHACGEDEMTKWRFVGGGDQSSELKFHLPPGVAVQIPKGARLVLQSHYVNTGKTALRVRDLVAIETPLDTSKITARADSLIVNDSEFRIPAHGTQLRVSDCTIESDIKLLNIMGHTHEWGDRVRIGLLRAGADKTQWLYNETDGVRLQFNAPLLDFTADGSPGLSLNKGDRVRLECTWKNTTMGTLEFPKEMCVAIGYYMPGNGAIVCGKPVETQGDTISTDGEYGMRGCTTPPAPGDLCARPCDLGNSRGVGKYCTTAKDCEGNQSAVFCAGSLEPTKPFCTKPCTDDASCGPEAKCLGDSRGMGCVPVLCAGG
jgi:hypothetical protein